MATVVLSGLTIRNGSAYDNGISPCGGAGGGICNYNSNGTLTINNSTVSGNVANGGGCSMFPPFCYGGAGGGIYSSGTLTINNSTISGNVAAAAGRISPVWPGGGIAFTGTLIINNSTVSGNKASVRRLGFYGPFGGGISSSSGTLVISNSTISGNTAYDGGGIASGSGTLKIQNSIVANNTGGNCYGTTVTSSHGYNLSSDNTCNFSSSGDRNNLLTPSWAHWAIMADRHRLSRCSPAALQLMLATPAAAEIAKAIC
jgi:hypothetical protein